MKPLIRITGCAIQKDGKYLLVQEKKPKAYGLWDLPAGHVDQRETYEQGGVREAKEETGYTVKISRLLHTEHAVGDEGNYEIKVFEANIESGSLAFPPDEILDAGWKSFAEVQQLYESGMLRNPWVMTAVTLVENS